MMRKTTNRPQGRRSVRLLTYNVHSCRGTDGKTDPARIAEVIARCGADIVALQEVDVGRARSGGIDQAQAIAAHLRMRSYFHPALHLEGEQYGDAILTSLPARLIKAAPLPSISEQRGAIWVAVDLDGTDLNVLNTHLGLWRRERMVQVAALLGPGWLGAAERIDTPTVLLGDFNAVPSSSAYRHLARHFRDAQNRASTRPGATFPSRLPILRLDHIFVGEGIDVTRSQVHSDRQIRAASDHLPVSATIAVPTKPRIGDLDRHSPASTPT